MRKKEIKRYSYNSSLKVSLSFCFHLCARRAAPCFYSVITKRHTDSGGSCLYSLYSTATSTPHPTPHYLHLLSFLLLSSSHFSPETFLICLSPSSYSSSYFSVTSLCVSFFHCPGNVSLSL